MPDTDRELMELAARAAGHEVRAIRQAERDADGFGTVGLWLVNGTTCWNPLTDDGDALRLAVKLGLKIMPYPIYGAQKHSVIVSKRVPATDPESEVAYVGPECVVVYGDDPAAATRRAIVLAAAAMAPKSDATSMGENDA